MKTVRENTWKGVLAALIIIPVVMFLTWIFQDIARRMVVLPASYVVWLFGRLLDSTPQFFIWITLIFVMGILIGKSLSTRSATNRETPSAEKKPVRRSRLKYWLVQLNQQSEFSRSRLIESVDRLALDVLTYTYQSPTWQVEKRLLDDEIDAPRELVTFIKMRRKSPNYQAFTMAEFIKNLLNYARDRLTKKRAMIQRPETNRELEMILEYLEDELEIPHGNKHT